MSDGDLKLLELLSAESKRRAPVILEGASAAADGPVDTSTIEAMRGEAHGLKGAAAVVGQPRLADIAAAVETRLTAAAEAGELPAEEARTISSAIEAYRAGADALVAGEPEPGAVATALDNLAAGR